MPFAPSSFLLLVVRHLLLVAMPFAPSSFLLLVVWPGAPSSVLAPIVWDESMLKATKLWD